MSTWNVEAGGFASGRGQHAEFRRAGSRTPQIHLERVAGRWPRSSRTQRSVTQVLPAGRVAIGRRTVAAGRGPHRQGRVAGEKRRERVGTRMRTFHSVLAISLRLAFDQSPRSVTPHRRSSSPRTTCPSAARHPTPRLPRSLVLLPCPPRPRPADVQALVGIVIEVRGAGSERLRLQCCPMHRGPHCWPWPGRPPLRARSSMPTGCGPTALWPSTAMTTDAGPQDTGAPSEQLLPRAHRAISTSGPGCTAPTAASLTNTCPSTSTSTSSAKPPLRRGGCLPRAARPRRHPPAHD